MNKYELLQDDKIEVSGRTLYRIRALKDFSDVRVGDLGGYIERKENLSQKGNCWVYNNAYVFGDARVYGNAYVFDNAYVFGSAEVYGNAKVYGSAWIYGSAWVGGNAWFCGNAKVCGNAKISKSNDILCITPIGSRNDVTTFFKTKDNNICVKCGCFSGTIDRFLEAVNETHGENKHAKAYKLACELARVQIDLEDKINE